jgi:hypothetical protein
MSRGCAAGDQLLLRSIDRGDHVSDVRIPRRRVAGARVLAHVASIGILSASTYLERKNPAYKLQVIKTLFNFDLAPVGGPNRKHRRAAAAQGGAPAVPAYRNFTKGQLGFEVWNRASFPLSVIVTAAETEIEGEKPPRGKFPKSPVIIQPGTTAWIHDDRIDLQNMQCDNLDGSLDITIHYGRPGREKFVLNQKGTVEIFQKGTVEIFMETYGHFKGLYFHPASSEPSVVSRSSS